MLIGLIALVAFAWLGVAYVVADTGYLGGISARDEQLIYATVSFILGMAGWLVIWRREVYVKDLGVTFRCLFENIRTELAGLGGRNSPQTPLPPASPRLPDRNS